MKITYSSAYQKKENHPFSIVRYKLSSRSAIVGTKTYHSFIGVEGAASHPHSETKRVRPLVTYLIGPTPTFFKRKAQQGKSLIFAEPTRKREINKKITREKD